MKVDGSPCVGHKCDMRSHFTDPLVPLTISKKQNNILFVEFMEEPRLTKILIEFSKHHGGLIFFIDIPLNSKVPGERFTPTLVIMSTTLLYFLSTWKKDILSNCLNSSTIWH